jgi:hypothetical protein
LVSLENEETQKEIESEKAEEEGFVYTSKDGKKFKNFNFDLERWGFNRASNINMSEGRINVREELVNKTVSKYIYNKIEKFDDYKKLIRFTKFIKYEELINIVMKHDIEYIINLFNLVEFRDDITIERLNGQIIPLTLDYLKNRNSNYLGAVDNADRIKMLAGIDVVEEESPVTTKEDENTTLNYSLLQGFSFYEYDDSVRMINALNWDRNKEFDKIRKISELKEYHDKLVEHYNMISDKEKNERFAMFAERFKYLEEWDGDYKIKLLAKPKMVLDAAKDMKNCAGSYVTRISNGTYLLLMIYDKSKEKTTEEHDRFMMGLNVTPAGLVFEQLKAPCNDLASNRQKELTMSYLEDKDISYKEVRDLRIVDKERGSSGTLNFQDMF